MIHVFHFSALPLFHSSGLTCAAVIGTVALAIVLPYPNLIADVAHQQAAH